MGKVFDIGASLATRRGLAKPRQVEATPGYAQGSQGQACVAWKGWPSTRGGEGGAAPSGTVTHARAKPRCARVMAGELSRPGHSVSALCIRRGGFGSRRRGHACRRGDSFGKLIGMPGSGLAVTWRLGLLASGRHVA